MEIRSQVKTIERQNNWLEERLYSDGDTFFEALIAAFNTATRDILLEIYIFDDDEIGNRVADALIAAANRGVRVRVLVDSIGSLQSKFALAKKFRNTTVAFQVYHQLPWERVAEEHAPLTRRSLGIFSLLRRINKRTHRKYTVIDGTDAFVGGMNISRTQLVSLCGDQSWRDYGAQVRGPAISDLINAFERIWNRRHPSIKARYRPQVKFPHLVRLNYTRKLRREILSELLARMQSASGRIWISSAYFVPHRRIRRAIALAAKRGVDVRILVPERSDVFFLPWVANRFYDKLLHSGAKVYEYTPSMLHAKSMIIDNWCVVGSTNLNHRSLLHDLEVDVVLDPTRAGAELIENFQKDLTVSREVSNETLSQLSMTQRAFARFALLFERYL